MLKSPKLKSKNSIFVIAQKKIVVIKTTVIFCTVCLELLVIKSIKENILEIVLILEITEFL